MTSEKSVPRAKVRKIFKKGDTYICGLCGSTFADLLDVQANLRECTKNFLADGGTIETAPKRYRCSFCKRVYNSVEEAKVCSANCRTGIDARIASEAKAGQAVSAENKLEVLAQYIKDPLALTALQAAKSPRPAQPIADLPKLSVYVPKKTEIMEGENIKFTRDKDQFRCMRCKQRYGSVEDVKRCFDSHGETLVSHAKPKSTDARYSLDGKKFRCNTCERLYLSIEDVVKCSQTHDVAVVGKTKKEGDQLAFFRDGAKYVCRTCSKKYFSKDDVIACFEADKTRPAAPVTAAAAAAKAMNHVPKTLASKKDDAEKFFRDGAKYVCRGCNKKHFSRDETLACFDGHGIA